MIWNEMSTLPPDDGMYLVYAASADPEKPLVVTAWWDELEKAWKSLVPYWSRAVTHWMMLPEPPKRGEA